MAELTEDQERVLNYVACFNPSDSSTIRADLRCAFAELELLGLIAPTTRYHLTKKGQLLAEWVDEEHEQS